MPEAAPVADLIVRRLVDLGVRHVFGYPGGQLTPIYDALYREPRIRHVLARHEQAAAFMADGYARVTGRPGVCLAVCGPGVYNAATPLHAAFTDSIPMLLISGQVPSAGLGPRTGYYHENDQRSAVASFTKLQVRAADPSTAVHELDRAWFATRLGRPGPVLYEVPVDIQRTDVAYPAWPSVLELPGPRGDTSGSAEHLMRLVTSWRRPLILAGGGVISAGAEDGLRELAERLGAPVIHTANGKCAIHSSHPLAAGMPWTRATSDLSNMASMFSPLFAEADGVLALGCRFSQLTTGTWTLKLPRLAQIDIDPAEIGRHYPVESGIVCDLQILTPLAGRLPVGARQPWAPPAKPREPWRLPGIDILGPLRRALPPDGIVAADITRLAYLMMVEFPFEQRRCFLHPAGAVAMGYGLPAALGAKAAFPDRPVVAVAGDGGFQMSAMELATAVQERLPVVVVLVNDNSLTLIRATQEWRYAGRFIGVDLRNPDFAQFVRSFGAAYWRADDEATFEHAIRQALACGEPAVVEVRPGDARVGWTRDQ